MKTHSDVFLINVSYNARHEQDDPNEGTLQDGGGHPPGCAEIQQQEDREPPSLSL